MYVIDKPLYAIQLPNGDLAEDQWAEDLPIWVTFSKNFAEDEASRTEGAKVVLYSDCLFTRQLKNIDDLPEFPVHGGQPLPEDLL